MTSKTAQNSARGFGLVVETAQAIESLTCSPDFLYLPGHVCRQADILAAARASGVPLVVERGVFLPPNDIARFVEKLAGSVFAIVECGSFNGYGDRVLDLRILDVLCRQIPHVGLHEPLLQGSLAWAPHEHTELWLEKLQGIFPISFFVKNNSPTTQNREENLYDSYTVHPLA